MSIYQDNQFDAFALRLPALGPEGGSLQDNRPVMVFARQGLDGAQLDRPTPAAGSNFLFEGGAPSLAGISAPKISGVGGGASMAAPCNRVIFIVDRSGSTDDNLTSRHRETKLQHLQKCIRGLSAGDLPGDAKLALIEFDSDATLAEFNSVSQGGLKELTEAINALTSRDGTKFEPPFTLCRDLLMRDFEEALKTGGKDAAAALRPVIIFATDGQDGEPVAANSVLKQIRDLNATIAVVGEGENYSMPRIVELSGIAGASSWSHLPMENKALDVFKVQIPAMFREVESNDHYFKLAGEGSIALMACATPSIRFAQGYDRKVYPGYSGDMAAAVYEFRDNLKLKLSAGRNYQEMSPYEIEVPITDIEDAVGRFEDCQRAKEFNERILLIRAMLNTDVVALKAMCDINPALKDQLDEVINKFEHGGFDDGDNHDTYSTMTQTGYTSVRMPGGLFGANPDSIETAGKMSHTMPAGMPVPGKQKNDKKADAGASADESLEEGPGNSEHEPQESDSGALHSGPIGFLNNPAPVSSLAPADEPNAAAYDDVAPVRGPVPSLTITLNGQTSQVKLPLLEHGMPYIIGRHLNQPGGVPVTIAEQTVSRQHCQITLEGETYFIEDLGSSNGTRINGGQVIEKRKKVELKFGDFILIGARARISFELPQKGA